MAVPVQNVLNFSRTLLVKISLVWWYQSSVSSFSISPTPPQRSHATQCASRYPPCSQSTTGLSCSVQPSPAQILHVSNSGGLIINFAGTTAHIAMNQLVLWDVALVLFGEAHEKRHPALALPLTSRTSNFACLEHWRFARLDIGLACHSRTLKFISGRRKSMTSSSERHSCQIQPADIISSRTSH